MKRKFLTSAWRHSMSSTRKAAVQAGPTYSLSDAASTTPAAATEAAGAATEAAEVATGAAEVAAAGAGVAASELGSPAAAAAAAIGVGGTAYGSGAIIEIGHCRRGECPGQGRRWECGCGARVPIWCQFLILVAEIRQRRRERQIWSTSWRSQHLEPLSRRGLSRS